MERAAYVLLRCYAALLAAPEESSPADVHSIAQNPMQGYTGVERRMSMNGEQQPIEKVAEQHLAAFQPVTEMIERLFTIYGEAGNAMMQAFTHALEPVTQNNQIPEHIPGVPLAQYMSNNLITEETFMKLSANRHKEMYGEWLALSEEDKHLRELAERYHADCDAYDNRVCTGISPRTGEAIPVTPYELGLVGKHARTVRESLIREGESMGLTAKQVEQAIRNYCK